MKNIIPLLCILLLCVACPIYDPPPDIIEVHNYSDEPIYVYYSCSDSIKKLPELRLFETFRKNGENVIIAPTYRVPPYSYKPVIAVGSREEYIESCPHKKLYIYIIMEETMKTKTWNEIYRNQLYKKRVSLGIEEFKKLDWVVKYKPPK